MSGNQSLFQAMQMFNEGLQSYAMTRAVTGAKDEVRQIQDNLVDEDEKKTALRQVANNLTMDLTQLDVPVSQIQNVVQSFKPKDQPLMQTPFEGLMYGDTAQRKVAEDYLATQHKNKLDEIKAHEAAAARAAAGGGDFKREKFIQTQYAQANKEANDAIVSSRSNMGRMGQAYNKIIDAKEGLLHGDGTAAYNLITKGELAAAVDSIFQQGQPTVTGREHLVPPTIQEVVAKAQTFASGDPANIDTPGMIKAFDDILSRMETITAAQKRAMAKQTLRTKTPIMQMDEKNNPGRFSKSLPESLIQNPDGQPETARLKNGQIRFYSDDKITELRQAAQHVLENPHDPKSEMILQGIVNDPFYVQGIIEDRSFKALVNKASEKVSAARFGAPKEEKKK